jgi:hypothetical protein
LRLSPPQVVAQRRRQSIFTLLVFGSHLRHMALAFLAGKPG